MKLIYLSLSCCLLAGVVSCNADSNIHTTEATLRWTGPLAADGCGFFLDIEGQEYKPSNEEIIPDAFREEDVQTVEVTYQELDEAVEYSCGMTPSIYKSTIKIIEVKRL